MALTFPQPVDTLANVSEYPLVSRALMLPGGSTDATLADLNGDLREDLIVAVSDAKTVSLFFRQPDGNFLSYPSSNTSMDRQPIAIATADSFGTGNLQVLVLGRRNSDTDTEHLYVFNYSSETEPLVEYHVLQVRRTAQSFVIGHLNGDTYPDVALVCPGFSPSTNRGVVEIRWGPDYMDYNLFNAAKGSNSIACGEFNSDGLQDLAVANYYDMNVTLFYQPFPIFKPADASISVDGAPVALVVGTFDDDAYDDLAIATEDRNALRFYFQALGHLPPTEDFNISLDARPSAIRAGLVSNDSLVDIVVLSAAQNTTEGFFQRSSGKRWLSEPDFKFPTGGIPWSCLIGQLDSDAVVDIGVSSARANWSGASFAIYSNHSGAYSNSNATAWYHGHATATQMSTGDLNGDDVEDLVLLYPAWEAFGCVLSFGNSASAKSLGFAPGHLLVDDFNRDGFDDVLVTQQNSVNISIYFGSLSAPGSFPLISRFAAGSTISDIATGDLNHDSCLDLVVATDDGRLDIFFNTQDEVPYNDPYELSPTPLAKIWSVVVGDFNSDGLDDLAYPRSTQSIDILLQRASEPHFALPVDITLRISYGDDFTALWGGEITGDSKTDIAAMRPSDPSIYLFDQEDFEGAPHPYGYLALPEFPKFVSLTDVTDDGHADVIAIFESADLLFMYKQGAGGFPEVPSMVFVTGAGPNYAMLGDGTRDHRGDLLVNNAGSHSVSAWEQINFPPTLDIGGPYLARQGDPVQFNGSAATGYSEIPYMEYNWSFGDGMCSGWVREPRPTHVYVQLGNFTVNVTVRDPGGKSDSGSTWVNVSDSYPHADFYWSPTDPREGQNVMIVDATSSFDPVVLLNWTIDGELVSSGMNLTIVREFQDGDHPVSLEATDSDGSVKKSTKVIHVSPASPDIMLVAPATALEGNAVEFQVMVDEWHGGPVDEIAIFEWNFSYDGGVFVAAINTGANNTVEHVFSSSAFPEIFIVAVKVTDIDGDWNLTTAEIAVSDIGPRASFVLSTGTPEEGVPFSIVDRTYSYDGIVSWEWRLAYPDGHYVPFALNGTEMAGIEFSNLSDGDYTMFLNVTEADGNRSSAKLSFHVTEIAPFVVLETLPMASSYEEFFEITFAASVTSFDPVVTYEWDFDAPGGVFQSDRSTGGGMTAYTYVQVGNYTAKVRVTDSDGSQRVQPVYVNISNKRLQGDFNTDVAWTRNPERTNEITFNASALAARFPDIIETMWSFGDGSELSMPGPPVGDVTHVYSPTDDYVVHLTVTDDDQDSLVLLTTLMLKQPSIALYQLEDGSVVNSGTPLQFMISPGSTPLVSVVYSVNGGVFYPFATLYLISSAGWDDGPYSIVVRASDEAGNVAVMSIAIVVDDDPPGVSVLAPLKSVYGGDKMNISVSVSDANMGPSGAVLYVMFPGDDSFSPFGMAAAGGGMFFRVIEVPSRAGELRYYVNVSDLAGNSATTDVLAVTVKMHLIDVVWPYLLAAAILAAFGTAAYFMREAKIAVDETFLIYNDGRLISHSTRRLKPGMDDQVLGGMLTAIQDFVKDSFKDVTSFTLRKLEFGEKSVLIEKGAHLYLAVILHGKASKKVAAKMQRVVDEIEKAFARHLREWDGDLDRLRGVNDIVKKLYSRAPILPGSMRRRET
ncbi:MAG: FG-GAP-like repeat-containing protein [Thermoplasmata archaeon]